MIEIIGLTFTILAALWARKQDIDRFLNDQFSRDRLLNDIVLPENRYRKLVLSLVKFLDRFFERGGRFFFAILMLSLLYVSVSFVFSLNFMENQNLFFAQGIDLESNKKVFLLFAVSMPIVWMLGSTHNRQANPRLINHKNRNRFVSRIKKLRPYFHHRAYYILSSLIFSILTQLVYESIVLTSFVFIVALLSSTLSLYAVPFYAMQGRYVEIFLGGTLGALGLLLAAFSFATATMKSVDYVFIVGLSILSGLLAAVSLRFSKAYADNTYRDFWRFTSVSDEGVQRMCSLAGKPSLFVAFYCARAGGAFCSAVSLILANVLYARSVVPEAVVSAGSIMLACIVFFSGATTLAGAGTFAFGTIVLIGVYMTTSPQLLFTTWASPFLLWVLLPLLNSLIDFLRWSITRANLEAYSKRVGSFQLRSIFVDSLLGVFGYLAYVFMTFFIMSMFSTVGAAFGYKLPYDISMVASSVGENLFTDGVWLLFMAGTMMIPTALQASLFLYAGLVFLFPKRYRISIAKNVKSSTSQIEKDITSWQIATMDVMGRLVFTALFLYVSISTVEELLPLIQEATANMSDYGLRFGNISANWVLANL